MLKFGSTFALQLMQKDHWFTCVRSKCGGATCPQLFFRGSDWNNCGGEVFQMYRAAGPGPILTGDFVGLYYPRENSWFSMWQGWGRKLTCPGKPSTNLGFQDQERWYRCPGEVFRVYAEGKPEGAEINDQDTLSLYYPFSQKYVAFKITEVALDGCPVKRSKPPSDQAFDECKYMSVDITIMTS